MNKDELINVLNSLNIAVNEGEQNIENTNVNPRIVFWDYRWTPITASGTEYDTVVTYQISFFANKPRHEKLIELKKALNNKKINPEIEHEYVQKDRCFHSFFSIEVNEKIG